MRKLLIVLILLTVIVVGLYIYSSSKKIEITGSEKTKIQAYIKDLYSWKELVGEALPEFKNINDANEEWVWDRVQQKLNTSEEYEYTYEQIEKAKKQLFGENLTKKFPKEGTEFLIYIDETEKYLAVGIGLDTDEDCFAISSINKNKEKYIVEIVEYIIDNGNSYEIDENAKNYEMYLKNLDNEKKEVFTADLYTETIDGEEYITSDTKDSEIEKYVLDNQNKFSKKIVTLEQDSQTNLLYVVNVKNK